MFAQMKSKRHYNIPCPCEDKCLCHKPQNENWRYIITTLILLLIPIIIFIAGVGIIRSASQQVRLIEVNGKMCEVHFKEISRTSTGYPIGHDEAVCK